MASILFLIIAAAGVVTYSTANMRLHLLVHVAFSTQAVLAKTFLNQAYAALRPRADPAEPEEDSYTCTATKGCEIGCCGALYVVPPRSCSSQPLLTLNSQRRRHGQGRLRRRSRFLRCELHLAVRLEKRVRPGMGHPVVQLVRLPPQRLLQCLWLLRHVAGLLRRQPRALARLRLQQQDGGSKDHRLLRRVECPATLR